MNEKVKSVYNLKAYQLYFFEAEFQISKTIIMSPPIRWPAESIDVTPLNQPLVLHPSGRVVKNRIVKSAMTEGLATWTIKNITERGIPTKEITELFRR
jgi:hypothetical protein